MLFIRTLLFITFFMSSSGFAAKFSELTLKDTAGLNVTLSSVVTDKVAVLDFWSTHCGPCRYEAPYEVALMKKYANNANVVFVFIAIDNVVAEWTRFVTGHFENLGIHLNSTGYWDSEAAKSYEIYSIPRFVVLDKTGTIINNNAPRPSSGQLEAIIDGALK